MNKIDNNTYRSTITLKHKNSVEMKYQIGFFDGINWSWYPEELTSIDLNVSFSSNEENENKKTPGFELKEILPPVIFILIILYLKRR